jgi:hypothetical protein
MRKAVDKLKWLSVSVTVASLVMVFWVWPAWNSGSQTWYWGNNQDSPNTMYRNAYPPSGHNEPFKLPSGDSTLSFMANERAAQMLNFGKESWQYQIEWYPTPMMMESTLTGMDPVSFNLTIGRWRGMGTMMYVPYFSAMGSGASTGKATGGVSHISEMGNLMFMRGDILGAMVMFMTPFPLTVLLAAPSAGPLADPEPNGSFITSPLSDPGYPGAGAGVPTLSQWGALVLAILLCFLYFSVIRRRVKVGNS